VLLYSTDRRLGLYRHASTRYRFHAIPVAISTLYRDRAHDYTAHRNLARHFHDADKSLDEQIKQAIHPDYDVGAGTYFWVADDRGLADYVTAAFTLFGPRTRSLSKFLFVVLGLAFLLYAVGYWRTPAAFLLPVLVLLGWLGIAQVMLHRVPFPNGVGWWGEEIALNESRMFDVLALVSVLHLAVLACGGPRVSRLAWATAMPQTLILVFLYHARSSVGWQYLALFAIAGVRVGWWVIVRPRPGARELARPLFVAALLAGTLVGLKQYQRAHYHPDYFTEAYGQRTFWHNALMGLWYHPTLRDELPMKVCDDRDAVDLVLARMEAKDPDLDRNQWNWQAALNSLGNHNPFDWVRYETEARAIYVGLWREEPGRMAACYGWYKPLDIAKQAARLGVRLSENAATGRAPEFLAGLALVLAALAGVVVAARRDHEFRASLRSLGRVVVCLVPFSLIPGVAFYPATATVSCFYLLSLTGAALLSVRLLTRGGTPHPVHHGS
jgi:hypothetical protein